MREISRRSRSNLSYMEPDDSRDQYTIYAEIVVENNDKTFYIYTECSPEQDMVIYYKASTKESPYDLSLERDKHMHDDDQTIFNEIIDKFLNLENFYSQTPLTELFAEQYDELFHMMDDVVIADGNHYHILGDELYDEEFYWKEL